jgi:hypothetical protein
VYLITKEFVRNNKKVQMIVRTGYRKHICLPTRATLLRPYKMYLRTLITLLLLGQLCLDDVVRISGVSTLPMGV